MNESSRPVTGMKMRMVLSHGDAMDLALKILKAINRWRAENDHRSFPGTIYMSVPDARACDEMTLSGPVTDSKVVVGHRFTLWGIPAVATDIHPGRAYLITPTPRRRR